MPANIFSILEPFIYLTEERDKRSLEKVLLETLSELISFEALILLRIPQHDKCEYLEPAMSIPESAWRDKLALLPHKYGEKQIEIDEWMNESIDFYKPVKSNMNGSRRAIFPIVSNKVIIGILDIYGFKDDAHSEELLIALTRIYGNFMAVLHDNEHDTLTGLLNRKTFDTRLSELLPDQGSVHLSVVHENENRNIEPDKEHWIGILDIDHFKKINDNFGHLYGDEVLLLFSDIMQETFRGSDLLFRFGGEEFVVVLLNTTEQDAVTVFEKFRNKIEDFSFPQVGQVTVSIGIAKIDEHVHRTTILDQTDKALYYAKEHGRNQTCSYHELIRAGLLSERQIDNNIDLF